MLDLLINHEPPTADAVRCDLLGLLLAAEEGQIDEDLAAQGAAAYRELWVVAQRWEQRTENDQDVEVRRLEKADADRLFRKYYLIAYAKVMKQSFPDYEVDDEVAWWPDAMPCDDSWPHRLLVDCARTLGSHAGRRSVQMFKFVREQSA